MKMPEPGWSILMAGLEPSSWPRGKKTVLGDSKIIVVIESVVEPLESAEADGPILSIFLFSSVGALS